MFSVFQYYCLVLTASWILFSISLQSYIWNTFPLLMATNIPFGNFGPRLTWVTSNRHFQSRDRNCCYSSFGRIFSQIDIKGIILLIRYQNVSFSFGSRVNGNPFHIRLEITPVRKQEAPDFCRICIILVNPKLFVRIIDISELIIYCDAFNFLQTAVFSKLTDNLSGNGSIFSESLYCHR